MARSDRIPDAMTTSGDYDEARNFFSSYFNEDWPDEAAEPAQIISLYLAEGWSAEELRRLSGEIRHFINCHADDGDLEHALFSELGSYYQPSADKIPARTWLQDLASTLEEAAERAAS
jgi:hypothetical protein